MSSTNRTPKLVAPRGAWIEAGCRSCGSGQMERGEGRASGTLCCFTVPRLAPPPPPFASPPLLGRGSAAIFAAAGGR